MAGEGIGKVPPRLQLDTAAAEHLVKHKISHKPACPGYGMINIGQYLGIPFGRSGSDLAMIGIRGLGNIWVTLGNGGQQGRTGQRTGLN